MGSGDRAASDAIGGSEDSEVGMGMGMGMGKGVSPGSVGLNTGGNADVLTSGEGGSKGMGMGGGPPPPPPAPLNAQTSTAEPQGIDSEVGGGSEVGMGMGMGKVCAHLRHFMLPLLSNVSSHHMAMSATTVVLVGGTVQRQQSQPLHKGSPKTPVVPRPFCSDLGGILYELSGVGPRFGNG